MSDLLYPFSDSPTLPKFGTWSENVLSFTRFMSAGGNLLLKFFAGTSDDVALEGSPYAGGPDNGSFWSAKIGGLLQTAKPRLMDLGYERIAYNTDAPESLALLVDLAFERAAQWDASLGVLSPVKET